MKRPPAPGDAAYVHGDEIVLDAWTSSSIPHRLVERAGVYRLEQWELHRWVGVEAGLQAVARRVATLVREKDRPEMEKVVQFNERRSG